MNKLRAEIELAIRLAHLTGIKLGRGDIQYTDSENALQEQVKDLYQKIASAEPIKESEVV